MVGRRINLRKSNRDGAALYMLVASISLMVSLIGLAGFVRLRIDQRTSERADDILIARRYAETAIELGWLKMLDDTNWRINLESSQETEHTILRGNYAVSFSDPIDNDLDDHPEDPVVIVGTGKQGTARQMVQVTLDPVLAPLSSLETALMAGGDLVFSWGSAVSNGILASNDDLGSYGAQVAAPVEAVDDIFGWTFQQSRKRPVAPRELPLADEVFKDYIDQGTRIAIGVVPVHNGNSLIQATLLSPQFNPYGSGLTNAQGIYVIDCEGRPIQIRNCRIVGTLVLLNADSGVVVKGSVHWQASELGYPCLLVDGPLRIDMEGSSLRENSSPRYNFNPPGTPYQGVSDSDQSDSYPSLIQGLIYTNRSAELAGRTTISGTLISRLGMSLEQSIEITYREEYIRNPPPGFRKIARWKVREGSWTRQVD